MKILLRIEDEQAKSAVMRTRLNYLILTIFTLLTGMSSFCQTDSVTVKGILKDAFFHKPIAHFDVKLAINYGSVHYNVKTDESGKFEFRISKKKYYTIELIDEKYVEKMIFSSDTNAVINFEVNLRPRNLSKTYQDIDSSILDAKVKSVFKKFNLELSDIRKIHEPPGALRGFEFELGDSTIVYVFIERIMDVGLNHRKFINQKIIGLGISRTNGTISYFGEGRPYVVRLYNKYFINELE